MRGSALKNKNAELAAKGKFQSKAKRKTIGNCIGTFLSAPVDQSIVRDYPCSFCCRVCSLGEACPAGGPGGTQVAQQRAATCLLACPCATASVTPFCSIFTIPPPPRSANPQEQFAPSPQQSTFHGLHVEFPLEPRNGGRTVISQ